MSNSLPYYTMTNPQTLHKTPSCLPLPTKKASTAVTTIRSIPLFPICMMTTLAQVATAKVNVPHGTMVFPAPLSPLLLPPYPAATTGRIQTPPTRSRTTALYLVLLVGMWTHIVVRAMTMLPLGAHVAAVHRPRRLASDTLWRRRFQASEPNLQTMTVPTMMMRAIHHPPPAIPTRIVGTRTVDLSRKGAARSDAAHTKCSTN